MTPEILYVYTIWQQGSFSKAAEKIYLTQPTLSMAILSWKRNWACRCLIVSITL